MKKPFLKLFFASFVLLFTFSCKKNGSSKSRTELLTQKAWIQSNQEIGIGGNWEVDPEFASLEACEKDDQIIFKTSKSIEVNEGTLKCEEATQVGTVGMWNLTDNDTKLTLNEETGSITQLDENVLIITGMADESTNANYRITFKH